MDSLTCKKCGEKEFYTTGEVALKGRFAGKLETINGKLLSFPRRITTWDTGSFGEIACGGCGAVIGEDGKDGGE